MKIAFVVYRLHAVEAHSLESQKEIIIKTTGIITHEGEVSISMTHAITKADKKKPELDTVFIIPKSSILSILRLEF